MWHGSWVLIWRRCHWVTTLLLMMILAYVTGTHTIIFGGSLSSNSSTSSLFLSLSLLFFSWRGRLQVLRYLIHFPSCQVKSPNIDHHWYHFREAPLLSPRDPETRVPQPPTSFSQQHLRSRLYQMFLDGLGQKSASNVRGLCQPRNKGLIFFLFAVCIKCFFKIYPTNDSSTPRWVVKLHGQKGGGVFFSEKSCHTTWGATTERYQRPSCSTILFTPT